MVPTKQASDASTFILLALVICSLVILVVDSNTRYLSVVKQWFSYVVEPVLSIGSAPKNVLLSIDRQFTTQQELLSQVAGLEIEVLRQEGLIQGYRAELEELKALRSTLGVYQKFSNEYQVAEIIGISPTPDRQEVTINLGSNDNVGIGMPVLDAFGIFGQITVVQPRTAVVLQVTDPQHAIPIIVQRNGLRFIAAGISQNHLLELEYVSASEDIRIGDQILSSGLGDRFPPGFAVGEVISIETLTSAANSRVRVVPAAKLQSSRYLLILAGKNNT